MFDVTGAGDTVIATLAAMLAAGLGLREAMPIANRAGGIVVGKFGTASVSYDELFARREQAMRVVVTGAAGMIGANLVHGLNAIGIDDVIAVDDLSDGAKFTQPASAPRSATTSTGATSTRRFAARRARPRSTACFHEGACSDTMEHDGRLMLDLNYRCSKTLLDACQAQGVRLLYASSAATYGGATAFREEPEFERPLNVYGWSKLLFDQVVRRALPAAKTQIAGFRYFNVYGPREQHKGRMASVAFHQFNEWQASGRVKLFGEYGGYAAGRAARATSSPSSDVVAVNLWFLEHPEASGIFNLGSGRAQPFNDVALAVVNACARASRRGGAAARGAGRRRRRSSTSTSRRRWSASTSASPRPTSAGCARVGCQHAFADVASGVARYVAWLQRQA